MKLKSNKTRKFIDEIVKLLSTIISANIIILLLIIIYLVSIKGFSAINYNFFTSLPSPPGTAEGGIGNALLGSLLMVIIASVMSIPIGIITGICLSEYARHTKIASWIKFTTSILNGTPSILIGLFIYTLCVIPSKNFSGYAGSMALFVIMLPIITKVTEEMLILIPSQLREAALALGSPKWKMVVHIILKSAKSGIITGVILAIARVSGETAPLIFTALNNQYWPDNLKQPTANLPVTMLNYAMSPYADWQSTAWGAALFIMIFVLFITIVTRAFFEKGGR